MISEQQQEQASLYALGALDASSSRDFEAELRGDAELREFVRSLQRTSDLLALAVPAAPLPPLLRDRVLKRAAAEGTGREVEAAPRFSMPEGLRFMQAAGGAGWKELPVRGAWIKLLSLEKERGYAVLLGKLEPGVRYPAHLNAGPEDFYILTGDLVIGDRKLVAGDFHHADAGTEHVENYSVEGCTLLAVLTTDDPLVAYAMG